MKAPDKIYIDIIDMDSGYMMAPSFENNGGLEYIRKDAILALIESRLSEIIGDAQPKPALRAELQELIKRIKDEN